jgi:uncharacterized protein
MDGIMFDWLQNTTDLLVHNWLSLPVGSKAGDALNFFIYDTIMGVINSYFPVEKIRNFLSRNRLFGLEYLLASVFGAITPFCSCSSVPLFIGFVRGGIPLGVTLAFLITSPLVNGVAIAMFLGMFGARATVIFVVSGILLGMVGGFVLGKLKLEKYLTDWVKDMLKQAKTEGELEEEKLSFGKRLPVIFSEATGIIRGIFWYVIIGIGIGAMMHGFIPTGFFEAYISKDNFLAVPISVLLGVPMYSNAAGVLPIIEVFVQKGIPIGTAIAFMMAVVGLSFPEAMMLKKVMTFKLIAIFFGVVAFFIMLSGYLFNWIM